MTSLRRISRAFLILTMVVALFGVLPAVAGAAGNDGGNNDAPRGCAFGNGGKNGQTMTAPGCDKARNGKHGNNGGMNDGKRGGMNDGKRGGMNDGKHGGMNDGKHGGKHGGKSR